MAFRRSIQGTGARRRIITGRRPYVPRYEKNNNTKIESIDEFEKEYLAFVEELKKRQAEKNQPAEES